jgi:hypothetical protein
MKILRRVTHPWLLAALLAGVGPATVSGQACPTGTISEITYDRRKPFGPEATSEEAKLGWLFRGMNAIHVTTIPAAIRWELLFREGDCLDPVLLEESARSLRSLPYIVEATVTSERLADGTHRVDIRTIDAWALSLAISFTVDQGFQFTGLSINAKNLFGTGTQVALFRNVYRERKRIGVLGRQPNLFGTRIDASIHGGETRSGAYFSESLFRPYPGEVGVNAFRQVAEARDDYFLYSVDPDLGFTQAYLRFEAERYELTYQHRFGDEEGARFIGGVGISRETVRFPFGMEGVAIVTDNDFESPTQAPADVIAEVAPQARNHEINRLSFVFGFRNLNFLNMVGLDAVRATQDVFDGGDLTLTLAPGVPLGDDEVNDLLVRAQGSLGVRAGEAYFRFGGDFQARNVFSDLGPGEEGWRDVMYELVGNGYWDQGPDRQLYSRVYYSAGYAMDRPFQLTVGGREAVRGYNEDAYPAARRLLATVEQRFTPPWRTAFADIGFAAFADAGRGWAGGVPFGEDSGWKAGVGVGVRLALPAGAPNVLRVDLGVPLTGERETKGIVFRIYSELFGILDRRAWPTQVQRSRWYGTDPDLTTRPNNPLSGN